MKLDITYDWKVLRISKEFNGKDGILPCKVVLRFNERDKNTPYVTHLQTNDRKGHLSYVQGHYFGSNHLLEAYQDFDRRLEIYKAIEDKDLLSVLRESY